MKNLLIFFIVLFTNIQSCIAMEVAITIDDLPQHGTLPQNVSRMDVENKILRVLHKHHIYHVYGFLNAKNGSSNNPVLKKWIQSENFLGNHTYSHMDLSKVSTEDYINDIRKNETVLKSLMQNKNYNYFRYPYLAEGNSIEKRNQVRQYLKNNHYQVAEVTVDFFESEWNDPYVRCIKKNDYLSQQWIKNNYLEQSINALTIAHTLSIQLFNRDIKNILLIHMNLLSAEMLDKLLSAYEQQGVKFISLSDALSDEVYKIDPRIIKNRTYTFLNQVRMARGLKNPVSVTKLYDSFQEDKLNTMCR